MMSAKMIEAARFAKIKTTPFGTGPAGHERRVTKGGTIYQWSDNSEAWIRIGHIDDAIRRWERLVESAKTLDWHTFVAEYVVWASAKPENFDYYRYKVTKTDDGLYQLWFGQMTSYPPMTAQNLYSWMGRLVISRLALEGDELRIRVLSEQKRSV